MASPLVAKLDGAAPIVLSLFRIVVGFLFLCYGFAHLFGWPLVAVVPGQPNVSFEQSPGSLAWFAGVIELLAGTLITLGAGTRAVAFVASGTMAVAYFTQHQPHGLLPIENNGTAAALFSWVFLLLVFVGGGSLSVDAALTKS